MNGPQRRRAAIHLRWLVRGEPPLMRSTWTFLIGARLRLEQDGLDGLGVDAQLLDGVRCDGGLDLSEHREAPERRRDHMLGVDLEVSTQRSAGVRATVAVGPQRRDVADPA